VHHSITANEYRDFRSFLESATGITLGENKHYLVMSRLQQLLEERGLANIRELLINLRCDQRGELHNRVIEAMTTNETLWFRDTHPYAILKNLILPQLASLGTRRVIIWSAACSTGQEPYSISMTVEEFLDNHPGAFSRGVAILASDISPRILEEARLAIYDISGITRGLSEDRRRRFTLPITTKTGPAWEIHPKIRSRVTFREVNLNQPFTGIGRFDIIFCRNVLIYFSAELRQNIIKRLSSALNPKGWLMLGASESIAGLADNFEMVHAERSIVYRLKK